MGLHYSTKNKVNLFADYLESSFQENPEPYDDDFIERVEEKVDDFMHHNSRHHTAPLTSPQEVMEIILKSPNKKAPGMDSTIIALVTQLNSCRNSDTTAVVLTTAEEHDAKLREYPFPLQEEQSAALRSLSDVLDEARFKYTHQRSENWKKEKRSYKTRSMPGRP
ncbi:hypothetical protein TNCT_485851 [Trichonephila clavata]|uniref:Uncharacterized protein n=1 Tax=Trichonephila clavata TaxID=2740835 RepID=A0A8X6F3C8_TRICU|nr:hypothetical protein TNCT_485851 [Trichonephila clavata]